MQPTLRANGISRKASKAHHHSVCRVSVHVHSSGQVTCAFDAPRLVPLLVASAASGHKCKRIIVNMCHVDPKVSEFEESYVCGKIYLLQFLRLEQIIGLVNMFTTSLVIKL